MRETASATTAQEFRAELDRLCSKPFPADERWEERTGEQIGIRMMRVPYAGGNQIDVTVELFWRRMPLPDPVEAENDTEAFAAFAAALNDPQVGMRMAACEALGHLGHAGTTELLHHALQDESALVRAAARRGLAMLEVPRGRRADLSSVRLVLWRQVAHLWRLVTAAVTDKRGRVVFREVPADAVVRVQVLAETLPGRVRLPAQPRHAGQALAALDANATSRPQMRPQAGEITVGAGSLAWTVSGQKDGPLVLELRSSAEQFRGGGVEVRVRRGETHDVVHHTVVPFKEGFRETVVATVPLTGVDLSADCDIEVDPLVPPPSSGE
jgi:hypothetical protein